MRTLIIAIFAMALGCDSGENEQNDGLTGTWKLTEVVSGWTNTTTPASELDYEEFYQFKSNKRMKKLRSTGEEAEGTYEVKELSDGTYIEIIYDNPDNDLKESCGGNEFLRVTDGQLQGGSLPCDGPGLTYEKVRRQSD